MRWSAVICSKSITSESSLVICNFAWFDMQVLRGNWNDRTFGGPPLQKVDLICLTGHKQWTPHTRSIDRKGWNANSLAQHKIAGNRTLISIKILHSCKTANFCLFPLSVWLDAVLCGALRTRLATEPFFIINRPSFIREWSARQWPQGLIPLSSASYLHFLNDYMIYCNGKVKAKVALVAPPQRWAPLVLLLQLLVVAVKFAKVTRREAIIKKLVDSRSGSFHIRAVTMERGCN